METKVAAASKATKQKIQLVKGEFTSSESYDVILSLIDEKINFHKLQRLQRWEGDQLCETDMLDGRIKELFEEKENIKEFLAATRAQGKNYVINGVLEIKMID